jgi:hypothetical protein
LRGKEVQSDTTFIYKYKTLLRKLRRLKKLIIVLNLLTTDVFYNFFFKGENVLMFSLEYLLYIVGKKYTIAKGILVKN